MKLLRLIVIAVLPICDGCVFIPTQPIEAKSFMIGGPHNTRNADAVDAILTTIDVKSEQRRLLSLMRSKGSNGRLLVRFSEPAKAWGITLNQHFLYLPFPLFGVDTTTESGIELEYNESRIVTDWHYRHEPGIQGYSSLYTEQYSAVFGEVGAEKVARHEKTRSK